MVRSGLLKAATVGRRLFHRRAGRTSKPQQPPLPPPPPPPRPPQKPTPVSLHGETLHDPYAWMASLSDTVAMRHMDLHMEQEERYTEAVLASLGADRLVRKLQMEMAPRLASNLSTPPLRWGPWLYYRRVEEGKQYPVLCRRKASLHEEFISYSDPTAGFDFTAGKKIEQKLIDYNQEAERFGGYSYEELSEVSPDHNFIAYTMYDKEKDSFTLLVRDLTTGLLLDRPRADRVAGISWAMNGRALLYTVVNNDRRPYRIYCSVLGSTKDDAIIVEEADENIFLSIRNTKDFSFITVNVFSDSSSKVYLIRGDDPLSGMNLVWEGETQSHCVIEHNRGKLFLFTDSARDSHCLLFSESHLSSTNDWQNLLVDEPEITLLDADFCDTHMVLILKQENKFRLCSVKLPLPSAIKGPVRLSDLYPYNLALPDHVCQITSGPNYDFFSSVMRFTISSPVKEIQLTESQQDSMFPDFGLFKQHGEMPDAVVDYNLLNGKWAIVQQQNLLYERTKTLYGTSFASPTKENQTTDNSSIYDSSDGDNVWNDLLDYYECEYYFADSKCKKVLVPLTVIYSKKHKKEEAGPGLLHGHGAYGEVMDRRWRSELKSLLDRGWIVAFADVRGGGGHGKKWHHDGTRSNKINSINDFVSCAEFLIEKGIVKENKLAAWGYSAGGLLVASAINTNPSLFRTAILKVPFLDVLNTLLHPILPLTPIDYQEFGCPIFLEDFMAIKKYSPYENIKKDVLYPAVMITSSLSTRFGVWEAAKWAARARDLTVYDPQRPIVLNMTADIVEDSKYLQTKELAIETAFLLKMATDP